MKTILNLLAELADADLYALCEAIDIELQRREEPVSEVPDSARRRAIEREQSYRRRNGAARRRFALPAGRRPGAVLRDLVTGK